MEIKNIFNVGDIVEILVIHISGHVTALRVSDGGHVDYEVTYFIGDNFNVHMFSDYQLRK